GITRTGTVNAVSITDLDYFITIPKGAKELTFDLVATNPTNPAPDLDILGTCGSEVSLSPLIDFFGQFDFKTNSPSGTEKVVINGSSQPKLKNCAYHVVILNSSGVTADFSLTATAVPGNPAIFIFEDAARNSSGGSGETEMSVQSFK